ncbi:uncharacterized protein [Arachis hypogaea]|uniref:uncharacterized protein n=1 Tax=Arachis hypogaea TaxID=3818 RepID=UPI003B222086
MEKEKAVAQSSGIDKHKDVDVDEEYFDEGDDDMVGTISIIPTEYLGECESNPDGDYDQEDEEAFSFIRIEDEPGFFSRPTEKQMSHLRPLHIVAIVNGFKINKVLIDGGAATSLLPERMLRKVGKHFEEMVPTNIAVTDFSGNSMPAKGLVTLMVKVGSSKRHYVFVVVPSKASYNALLGRDWIHGVRVVPSIVHQSMLLWTKEGKPEIVKAYSSLYVEQMHVDFRIYNRKLKSLNVDRSLNPYNCEGCYLTSEGLSVKLRYPNLPFEPTDDSSDKVESYSISKSTSCSMFDSTPPVECSYDFSITCNEINDVSWTADLIAEAHCVENKCSNELIKDQVSSISNSINFTFDCIYELEPLGFEKYSIEDDHYKGFESQDPLEEVNLGTHDDVRITYICKDLVDPFRTEIFNLLHEFKDCFAWDYHEMPGLDRSLVEHRLALKPNARPVKQTPRRFAPEINMKIKEEIERLIKAKFIRTTRYVEWVSNIVPVMKKNGKLRDEYFMPIVDILIDYAAGNEILSFMDGYSRYNQIFIAEDDVAKTAFRCPGALGTYEWVVMPFGLKNAGATYQRTMNAIFHEFIGKFTEMYIDDVMVKSISMLALIEVDLQYVPAKAVKRQVIADFLMDNSKDLNDQGANIVDVEVSLVHIPRIHNEIANELAQIASRYQIGPETIKKLSSIHQILVPANEREMLCIDEWEDSK